MASLFVNKNPEVDSPNFIDVEMSYWVKDYGLTLVVEPDSQRRHPDFVSGQRSIGIIKYFQSICQITRDLISEVLLAIDDSERNHVPLVSHWKSTPSRTKYEAKPC